MIEHTMGRQLEMFLDGSNSSHYIPPDRYNEFMQSSLPPHFQQVANQEQDIDKLFNPKHLPFNVEREQTKLSASDLRGQNTKGSARLKRAKKSRSKRNN